MRSLQLLFWVIFILFYLLMSFGTVQMLRQFKHNKINSKTAHFVYFYSVGILISLVLLYVWPGNIRTATNFSLYYFFNGVLLLDLVFKTPLSLFYLLGKLFCKTTTRKIVGFIGLIFSVCISLSMLYGIVFGRRDVIVKRIELEFPTLPAKFNDYKLMQISDIHLGSFLHSKSVLIKVKDEVVKENPDLIVFTGDLVNNFSEELKGWDEIFREINAAGNSYSIMGNHDYGNYSDWESAGAKTDNLNAIVEGHKKFGFKLLRNNHSAISVACDTIYIVGVENWGHPPFPQYAELKRSLAGIPRDAFTILLTHDPAHWMAKVVGKENIALTLSGHTHGFQLGIVKAGIPFSLAWLTRKNWGGLYEHDGNYLYVNTGLGTIGIPWRINMPAEITIITLKRLEID